MAVVHTTGLLPTMVVVVVMTVVTEVVVTEANGGKDDLEMNAFCRVNLWDGLRGEKPREKATLSLLGNVCDQKSQTSGVNVVSEKRHTDCESVQENIACYVDNVCCS